MVQVQDTQYFDSFVPVYEVIPSKWEEARPAIVEQFKLIANAVNAREIGFFLDQEVVSGKLFIPGVNDVADGGSSQQFRTVLRKVIDFSPVTVGLNQRAHGIVFDGNFELIAIYGSGTNSITAPLFADPLTFAASPIHAMDVNNVNVQSASAYDKAVVVIEYIQEN